MQSQTYGISNSFGQFNTQRTLQQGYRQNNNPFAPPSEEFQAFNQQRYQNQPGYEFQQYNQQQHPPSQQNQFNQNSSQPYSYNSNNDDFPSQKINDWNNNTATPADVFVGMNAQDDVRNRNYNNDDDYVKPHNNQAHQNQDNKPQKSDSTQKPQRQRTSFAQYRRSISGWGVSDCSGIITSILGLGSVLVILVLMIALMSYHFGKKELSLTSTAGALDYMVFNLNADPILDLKWNGNACPRGTESIHFGRWPGSARGCSCPITGIHGGICSDDEDLLCTDVSDIEYADMFRWEGAVFCATRARLNQDYVKATNCPSGFRNCSSGICVKESLQCPLTSISLQSSGTNDNILTPDKYLAVSYTSGGAPIIDMDITINDIPCFSNTETPKGQGDYVLLDKHPNGCGTYGVDTLFSTKIDEVLQTKAISFNNLPSGILKLPGYKKITDKTTSYLSGRKRITVANNDVCLSLDTEIMNDASTAASDLNRYVTGTAITAMVFHSILFLLVCFGLCTAVGQSGWKETLKGRNSGAWLACYVVIGFIELIVFIVMKALVRKARNALVTSQDYLIKLDKLGCFPVGPSKQVIGDYDDVVDVVASKLDSLATSLLAVTLIAYVPIIAIIIYKNYCKK